MATPEWAKEVIAAHSIFEEAGIDVEVEWSGKRVEATCPDIPPYEFPARSWYVSKGFWKTGLVDKLLRKQLEHLQDYLDAD